MLRRRPCGSFPRCDGPQGMSSWPHQSSLPLAAMPNAPYWARQHTKDMLVKWGAGVLLTNAQLVVTELVTNAVRVSGTLEVTAQQHYAEEPRSVSYDELGDVGTVQLRLSYGLRRLLVEVWDKSEEPPARQLPDFESEGGRGLFLVSAFCERWGWYPSEQGGKVVWAEVARP